MCVCAEPAVSLLPSHHLASLPKKLRLLNLHAVPFTTLLLLPRPPLALHQAAAEALAAREASLADTQASLQAELDGLLAKQEERLRAWEAGCAELEAQLEQRRAALDGEEAR